MWQAVDQISKRPARMNYYARQNSNLEESSHKRKDRHTFYSSAKPSVPLRTVNNANLNFPISFHKGTDSQLPNPILAGYMALEFLTKGTLLGKKFDPAQTTAVPVDVVAECKKRKLSQGEEAEPLSGNRKVNPPPRKSYAEVASLLRSDATYIPGVVNPSQLVQWIQM